VKFAFAILQIVIVSVNGIKRLTFIMEINCVVCELNVYVLFRPGFLNQICAMDLRTTFQRKVFKCKK